MNNSNAQFGQNNFTLYYNFRDRFANTQSNPERIGDIGDVSEKFVKNAKNIQASRTKYKAKKFEDLALDPEKFIAPEWYGDPKKVMQYEPVERDDGKAHSDVMKTLDTTTDKIMKNLDQFKGKWDVNTFTSAMGSDPLTADDYDEED